MVLVIKFVIFELVFNLTLYLLYECRGFFFTAILEPLMYPFC